MSATNTNTDIAGDFSSFAYSVVLNAALLLVVIVAFWILRAFKSNKYFFAPQYYDSKDTEQELPALGTTPWAFVKTVLAFPEQRIMQLRGLDSVMHLRMLKLCTMIFALYIPLGCGLLLPLNATGHNGQSGIPSISLNNVTNGSSRMWAHVIVAVIFTFIALIMMYRTYRGYLESRIVWMKRNQAHNYTVMFKVSGVRTEELKAAHPQQYFSHLFPQNDVVGAHYTAADNAIYKLIEERKEKIKKLNFAKAALQSRGKRPTHRLTPLCGTKVDSITQYEEEVAYHTKQIDERYASFTQDPTYAHVAFVTFRTIGAATATSQLVMDRNIGGLEALPAPQPSDIYWDKLNRSRTISMFARVITWVACFALIFLWSIPIVFIQGIANLENLTKLSAFHWLNGVLDWSPIAKGVIQQFLPAIFTILFLALLPQIITVFVKFRGVYTKSELSRRVATIYFLFLLFNVFLVSLWAGGIFAVLGNLVNLSGWELLNFLGSGVAAQSLFFINYVLTYALFKYPLNIIRIGDFIKAVLKRTKTHSEEERRQVQRPNDYGFSTSIPIDILIFIIGFAYAVMSPFILPFILLFFCFVYVIGKYMIVYVYYPEWDSGGLYWPLMFNRMIAGMVLAQVTLIGVFVLRQFVGAAVIGPLPFITLGFMIWVNRKFEPCCTHLPYLEYPINCSGLPYADAYEDPIRAVTRRLTQDLEQGRAVAEIAKADEQIKPEASRPSLNDTRGFTDVPLGASM